MLVAIKREIVEDQSEISDFASAEPLKKKVRTARKCTGVGGKLPRQPIKTKESVTTHGTSKNDANEKCADKEQTIGSNNSGF